MILSIKQEELSSLKEKNNDYAIINKDLTNEISGLKSEILRLELELSQKKILEEQIIAFNREKTSEKFFMFLTLEKKRKKKKTS